jgi:hypothetical protein
MALKDSIDRLRGVEEGLQAPLLKKDTLDLEGEGREWVNNLFNILSLFRA